MCLREVGCNVRCLYCMEEYDEDLDVICPFCGNDVVDVENDSNCLPAGTVLKKRYVLGRVLGDGGFGITYIGYDKALKRKVAVKEFFPNECVTRQKGEKTVTPLSGERAVRYENGLKSFTEEAQRLANLGSVEGVVNVFDVFADNGTAYIVMEYLSGDTVAQIVETSHQLGFGKTMNIIVPVLRSLIKIHKAGIIHRDVSPQNIIRTKEGKIVLIDFGAARQNSLSMSKSVSIILKQGYAPIEQYDNKLKQDTWTDVYAVAATMYYMLTGITPEYANSRLLEDTLLPISEIREGLPPELDEILDKALAVRPEERTQTAQELLDQIMTLKDFKRDPGKKKPVKQEKPVKQSVASKKQWKSYVGSTPYEVVPTEPVKKDYEPKVITIDRNTQTTQKPVQRPQTERLEEPKKSFSPAIVALIIVAVLVLGALVTVGYLDKRDNMDVPNFVGQNINEILANSEYSFNFDVVYVYDPADPLDSVVEQSPAPTSRHVRRDSNVRLTVNSLDTEVTIPVISKMPESVALNTLSSLYLDGEVVVQHDDNFAEGTVIRTEPANGTKVKVRSKVTVYIAENSIQVPGVVGKTYDDAAAILKDAGLNVGEITYDYSEEYDTGYVISQGADSTIKVEKGTAISLVISQGRPYDVTISETVDLSTLKAPFKVAVYVDGEEELTKNFYSLAFRNSYDFDVTRLNTRGEVTVEVFIDGELYQEYLFDFRQNTSVLVAQNEVSAQKKADESKPSSDDDTSSEETSSAHTSSVHEDTSSEESAASKPEETTSDTSSTDVYPQQVTSEL